MSAFAPKADIAIRLMHGDDYQVTPAAADGAFTWKMETVSVFGRRGG